MSPVTLNFNPTSDPTSSPSTQPSTTAVDMPTLSPSTGIATTNSLLPTVFPSTALPSIVPSELPITTPSMTPFATPTIVPTTPVVPTNSPFKFKLPQPSSLNSFVVAANVTQNIANITVNQFDSVEFLYTNTLLTVFNNSYSLTVPLPTVTYQNVMSVSSSSLSPIAPAISYVANVISITFILDFRIPPSTLEFNNMIRYFNTSVISGQFGALFNRQRQAICTNNMNSLSCVQTTVIVYPPVVDNIIYLNNQPVSVPSLSPDSQSSNSGSSSGSGFNLTYVFFALLGAVILICCCIGMVALYVYTQFQVKKASVDEFFSMQQDMEEFPITVELRSSTSSLSQMPNPNTSTNNSTNPNIIDIGDNDDAALEEPVESSLRGSNLYKLFNLFGDPQEDHTPRVASLYSNKSSFKTSDDDRSSSHTNNNAQDMDPLTRRKSSKLELSGSISPYERYSAGSFRLSIDNAVAVEEDPVRDDDLAVTMGNVSATVNPMEETGNNDISDSSKNELSATENYDLVRQRSSKRIAVTVTKLASDIKNISL